MEQVAQVDDDQQPGQREEFALHGQAGGAGQPRQARQVAFAAADGSTLVGTLQLPAGEGPHPVALLLVGSGEVDRDSDHPKMRTGVTRQLAEALADAGIGSLRYDKRGVGASGGSYLESTFPDARADASAALATLHRQPEADRDRVLVIGHSEGALHAASLAAATPELAGVCLLAGPAVTGEEALRWQAHHIVATLPSPVRAVLRLLRQTPERAQGKLFAKVRGTEQDVMRIQGRRINAGWMRGFLDHDPAQDLARVEVPVLAVTGELDLQVDPEDVDRIAALVTRARVEAHRVPSVNHLLRHSNGTGSPTEYRKQLAAQQPVDPRVLAMVTTWAAGRVASAGVASP